MGKLALAAKITHVPAMYLSELDGPNKGCRQSAIDGHYEIARRLKELNVDTVVVFDTHWLINSRYHINCAPLFKDVYTSNELPHYIKNMPYEYKGNQELGHSIARVACASGIETLAHDDTTLGLEYGTLMPMRYMNQDKRLKIVSIAASCEWHHLEESAAFGAAVRKAIEEEYDGTVAIFASGSLSHRIAQNGTAPKYQDLIWDEFLHQVDLRAVELWQQGDWKSFCAMLPTYAETCYAEGGMHDTAMLLGAMGWDKYTAPVEIVTPYFPSSGTGQINAIFPVTD